MVKRWEALADGITDAAATIFSGAQERLDTKTKRGLD